MTLVDDPFAELRVPMAERPWPIQSLLDILAERQITGLRPVARAVNTTAQTLNRALATGALTDVQADNWCCAAGLFPLEVWGWAWCQAELDRLDAAGDPDAA